MTKILAIDDDNAILSRIQNSCTSSEHEVVIVPDYQTALILIPTIEFAIIISDNNIPSDNTFSNGVAFLASLSNRFPDMNLKKILISQTKQTTEKLLTSVMERMQGVFIPKNAQLEHNLQQELGV